MVGVVSILTFCGRRESEYADTVSVVDIGVGNDSPFLEQFGGKVGVPCVGYPSFSEVELEFVLWYRFGFSLMERRERRLFLFGEFAGEGENVVNLLVDVSGDEDRMVLPLL